MPPGYASTAAVTPLQASLAADASAAETIESKAGTTASKPARSKWRTEKTKNAYQFCYVEFRLKERKRPQLFDNARKKFGKARFLSESVITTYANRFAKREGHPRDPSPVERLKILALLEG